MAEANLGSAADDPATTVRHSRPIGALGGWRARWKLARLRSRADRAERRAAVAIHDASDSFGAALEAVLHAHARVKADQACVFPAAPAPRSRDQSDDRAHDAGKELLMSTVARLLPSGRGGDDPGLTQRGR